MYEVGVVAALEDEVLRVTGRTIEVYVGCSAGSVVAAVLANGVAASDLYRILDEDRADPLNFTRSAVYASNAFRRAFLQFARFVWALGKHATTGLRSSIPDMLARAERDFPVGFFSLTQLEQYLRTAFETRGLSNSFRELAYPLLIPAIDLDSAQRVVFGAGELSDVPISHAVAASSAIPGFFEPFTIRGRDYVDGGVGWSGHADLAADAGADVVVVVNPLVPVSTEAGERGLRARGLYFIMEQTNRIYSQNLLRQNLTGTRARHPKTVFYLIQPAGSHTPLFGPSMGFDGSRAALRYGYASTQHWLATEGTPFVRHLGLGGESIGRGGPQIS